MENNNYVSVGNIIEQERLKRQAQIAKGVSSDVYDHIEKAHQDDLSKGVEMTDNLSRFANDVDNLNKAETEFLLSKLQRQIVVDPESHLLKSFKSIAIEHLNDIEKATYVDNALNRKLGRVGQQYGSKKANDGSEKSAKHSRDWLRKHKATGERIKNKNFRGKYTVTPDGKVVRREMSGKKDKLPDTFRLPVKDSNLTRKVSGVSYTLNHASYDKQRGTIIVSATHPDGRKSEKTFHYNTDGELKKMRAAVKHYLETDGDRN